MKLEISFDDQLIKDYSSRGAGSFFDIRWQHDGEYYPSRDWTDFGATILGWWMTEIASLNQQSRHGELSFMDGPYAISLSLQEDANCVLCKFRTSKMNWTASLSDIKAEVIRGTKVVVEKLEQLDVNQNERSMLSSGLSMLLNNEK